MILLALMGLPLVAAAGSAAWRRAAPAAALSLACSSGAALLSAWAALQVAASPAHRLVAVPHWIVLDALSAVILLLVAGVSATAALFSAGYMRFSRRREVSRYYVNFNLFVFSMVIVPLIQEPNIVWIAVELTTLFSVLLVGFAHTHEALEAAWKYVVLTLMGAAIALLGFLMLYWAARHTGAHPYTWTTLAQAGPRMPPVLVEAAFVLTLVGLGAKVGLVPLHTWLPDAHSQAPPPVCALLSGVETTTILYVVLRFLPIVSAVPAIHAGQWFVAFGLVSVGAAAFLLLRVRDYKRLFAFSTVEHMGIALTAAGMGGTAASAAALLQIVAHAATKSFCFYAAGAVLLVTGTTQISGVRGLLRRTPAAGAALLLGGLAIAGAPPLAVFLSEFSVLRAGIRQGSYLTVGLLTLFIVIAFFGVMGHVSRMVFDTTEDAPAPARPLSPLCALALVVAAIPIIVLGVYVPETLHRLIMLAALVLGG